MKTAKEMYDYCTEKDLGQGVSRLWGLQHFNLIQKELCIDEEVILPFIGLYNYQEATVHDGNFAFAVTDRRLMLAQKKLLESNSCSIDIKKIHDITLNFKGGKGIMKIMAGDDLLLVAMEKPESKRVYAAMCNLLKIDHADLASGKVETSISSAADEILKLRKLYDQGTLTEEEYKTKKKQLLGI